MTAEADNDLVACPTCDLLFNVGDLHHGERASCTRCGCFLTRVRDDGLEKLQSYSIAGLICLGIGSSFPFLSFQSSGIESIMTLPQTVQQLYDQGRPDLAFLVAAFIIAIPAAVLVILLMLSMCMRKQRFFPWMIPAARLVFHMQNWAMVEVFFIGVLVSLVKISGMATVAMGISFWGYGAFAILFIAAVSCLDRVQYWNELERIEELYRAR